MTDPNRILIFDTPVKSSYVEVPDTLADDIHRGAKGHHDSRQEGPRGARLEGLALVRGTIF